MKAPKTVYQPRTLDDPNDPINSEWFIPILKDEPLGTWQEDKSDVFFDSPRDARKVADNYFRSLPQEQAHEERSRTILATLSTTYEKMYNC